MTKAVTAVAVLQLFEQGRFMLDDPAAYFIPVLKTLRVMDPNQTGADPNQPRTVPLERDITIRDLLCHRAGLGTWAGDMLLLSKYSTEDIVRRIRYIPPEYSFRAGYGYCNLLFITAGLIIEKVSGMSWDDFIRQRIFEPLGMNDSVTNARYFGTAPTSRDRMKTSKNQP
jgi:CubicO group peptidase (beta-lactamase class C family)